MKQGTAIVGFILSFLAGMLVMWGMQQGGIGKGGTSIKAEKGAWSDEDAAIPVTSKDPIWGSRTAPVTVVVFSEFECPFCSRVEASLETLKTEYGPEKLRLVWKSYPLPFHANARPASVAAETVRALAGNDAFWQFHKSAFANQKALNRENFEKWAVEAGVDLAKFKDELDKNTYAAKVEEDEKLGKALGVKGTPHTFINGVVVNGARPVENFKEIVEAQLKEAQALLDSGTKADRVYVEATKKNFKAPAAAATAERRERPEPGEDKSVWNVPVGKSPMKGPADALVTIVLFSEYQCPFCKRVEPTLDQLLKDYGNKLRLVWKDRPLAFHADAEPAALFAAEARKQKGEKGFWDAHAILFENQGKFKMENFEEYARTLGLNWAAVKSAIENKTHIASIKADAELADTLKASGTPHMFINGRRLSGAQPIESFKKLIDEEMAKAEALVKAGTSKASVYEEIMKKGQTAPAVEKKNVPAPTAANPFKGGKNAKIVLQVFSDFECPFCGRIEPTMDELLAKYGDKIQVVWRNLPLSFHKQAKVAAEAAMEVFKQKGNEGFWRFHDTLFKNQRALSRADLERYAEEMGCDMAKFRAALDNGTHTKAVEEDAAIGARAGITGTPAVVINGHLVSGAQPTAEFEKVIQKAEAELKK